MSESSEEYVTIAEFIEPVYAQMAKGALESAGIESFLQGEHINNLQMGAVFAAALQVHRQDEEAAREILNEVDNASAAPREASDGFDDEDDDD
jgi:hypothetical protein